MPTLLEALLRNESGGRNIPNVHQGTSSGQAQGYFQITTGTWDEFGGRKYAPNPLQATYEQQADIASKIPLKRWDESTVASMRDTGRTVDPSRTLGENLALNAESFGGATTPSSVATTVPTSALAGLMSTTPTAAPQTFQPAFGDLVAANPVQTTPFGDDMGSIGLNFLKQAEKRRQNEEDADRERRRALFAQPAAGLGGLYG